MRKFDKRGVVTPAAQPELALEPAGLTLVELEAEIAHHQDRLTVLYRFRRARMGGIARAGLPRRKKASDEDIWSAFDAEYAKKKSGACLRTAARLRITPKTVRRARSRRTSGQ